MNFEEWEKTAESEKTIQVNRNIMRDFYTFPNGIRVMVDFVQPWNFFKSSFEIVVVNYIVPIDTKILNGIVADYYYTEAGFGLPEFKSLENAFNYAMTINQ